MKIFVLFLLFLSLGKASFAQSCLRERLQGLLKEAQAPFHLKNAGQINHIPDGTIIEGSVSKGGMQPHYIMDFNNPVFIPYLKFAEELKNSTLPFWDKVDAIRSLVNGKILPRRDYHDPRYLKLMEVYRNLKKDVPLSVYVSCGVGVCRENAFITHALLEKAGIPNTHIYAKIHRKGAGNSYDITEDHAFVVVNHEGKEWAVDSYYVGFNGYLMKDLMSETGITPTSSLAPIGNTHVEFRRIIEINQFPKALVPTKPEGR